MGSTEHYQSDGKPLVRSMTVPLAITVEVASDSATILGPSDASGRMDASETNTSTVVEERGSVSPTPSDRLDPENPALADDRAPNGWPTPTPRMNPVDRAASAFANFSLSRFTPETLPENFVRDADPTSVLAKQRTRFAKEVDSLDAANAQNSGMRLTVRASDRESLARALPGLGSDSGQIELADLLTLLKKNLAGTDFRSVGNQALRPLTAAQEMQDRAQGIIDRIKASAEPSSADGSVALHGSDHSSTDPGDMR
jgi:hypothetical protein